MNRARSKKRIRRRRRPTMKQWKRWEREGFRTRCRLEVSYRGYDLEIDNAIERAAKKSRDGSGMLMLTGLRDVDFEFKTERQAIAAARRIKKAVPGTRCMLHSSREFKR